MKEVMICTRCGSTKTWLENQLIFCARFSHWKLSYSDEIYSRMEQICPWIISLCYACAHNNYKESLTKTKNSCYYFMTKITPVLLFSGLGATFIMLLLTGSFGGASGVSGAALLAYLVGCGIAVAIAVIGFPINLIMFSKSSVKLNRISSSEYQFSEREKTETVYNEGDRIIDCIKTKSQNYYGNYALPESRLWSEPPFADLRLKSDASKINWSFEIVTPNEIMECVKKILSKSTVTTNHELYSLCDDFIEQLHRANKIDEKYYSKLKMRIINNREESKRQK